MLHCKTGARSAEALAVLKGAGFSDAVHVGGGVIAWANQIDRSLPTYCRRVVVARASDRSASASRPR